MIYLRGGSCLIKIETQKIRLTKVALHINKDIFKANKITFNKILMQDYYIFSGFRLKEKQVKSADETVAATSH